MHWRHHLTNSRQITSAVLGSCRQTCSRPVQFRLKKLVPIFIRHTTALVPRLKFRVLWGMCALKYDGFSI